MLRLSHQQQNLCPVQPIQFSLNVSERNLPLFQQNPMRVHYCVVACVPHCASLIPLALRDTGK